MRASALLFLAAAARAAAADPHLVGQWAFDAGATPGSVTDKTGGPAASFDSGAELLTLGVAGAHALRMYGNTSSTFTIPHHKSIDTVQEFTVTLWANWWWGPSKGTLISKDDSFSLEVIS